ncbi:hypothetical protein, partial [Pararhodobacter marinus]|uniref:hypothetical protein n=1 Tax=Pararhodobacter marinus TaxID=2184063 RepID=UPI003510F6B2
IFLLATLAQGQSWALDAAALGGAGVPEGLTAGVREGVRGVPVWRLAFEGLVPGDYSLLIALLIALHQRARYVVTTRLAPLLDLQRYDRVTPPRDAFAMLAVLDRLTALLGFVVLVIFSANLYLAATSVIYLGALP